MELIVSGRKLAFDVEGDGVPFVFLHPFPFDRRFGQDLAQGLSARSRVIRPDFRGFGESELGGAYAIADLAADVVALLDKMAVGRAVVGGVSMGGYAALAFAQQYPERLMGLVLADTKAGPDDAAARQGRAAAIETVKNEGVDAFVRNLIPRLLSQQASEDLRVRLPALANPRPDGVIAALTALRDRPDRTGELATIKCPTLIVVGTDDAITPPTEAAEMATAIRKAVLVEIPDAGHLSAIEAPEAFHQAVAGFLRRAVATG